MVAHRMQQASKFLILVLKVLHLQSQEINHLEFLDNYRHQHEQILLWYAFYIAVAL